MWLQIMTNFTIFLVGFQLVRLYKKENVRGLSGYLTNGKHGVFHKR